MRVLLIAPPVFDFYRTAHRQEPLGLLYQKAALEREGHSVTLYDAASRTVKKQRVPEELAYLHQFYYPDSSLFSLHTSYRRFGDSFAKIEAFLSTHSFDLIGVSSLFTAYHPDVELLIERIRSASTSPIVIGGSAIDAEPEYIARTTNADFVVRGASTVPICRLADYLEGHCSLESVPSLVVRKGNSVLFHREDTTPPWHGGVIPHRIGFRYFRGQSIASIVLSTGCRFRCSFCSIHRIRRHHLKPILLIEQELNNLVEEGVSIINIEDDDLFSGTDRDNELIELFEQFHARGLSFVALNGLTARSLEPLVHRLIHAGFIKFDLSLVAFSSAALSAVGRPHGPDAIESVVHAVDGAVETEVFMIPGLQRPFFDVTVNAVKKLYNLRVKIGLSPLYLLPGVPQLTRLGLPEQRRLCRGSALYPFNDKERNSVATLLKIVRFANASYNGSDDDFGEQRFYFRKSLERNRWYKQDKNGSWSDAFYFDENPEFVLSFL